ncbi:MAG TPA: hypothetical protein VM120_09025 [Bryobacteraceae bacterium]|nr:hypothetical protein [Bryobacteraceae bacterium]
MDVSKMISELRSELQEIEGVILALERLAIGGGKRRGRPPKWLAAARTTPENDGNGAASAAAPRPKKRKRTFSAETKRKMAEAQRKRWAAKDVSAVPEEQAAE